MTYSTATRLVCLTSICAAGHAQLFEPFPPVFEVSTLHPDGGGNGSTGVVVEGKAMQDWLGGSSVCFVGDLNGDGVQELAIGAPFESINGTDREGIAYVIFGQTIIDQAVVNVGDLQIGQGLMLLGANRFDKCGWSVGGAGDMNNDGIDDLAVSAPGANSATAIDAGNVYVLYGRPRGAEWPLTMSVLELVGDMGFRAEGIAQNDGV